MNVVRGILLAVAVAVFVLAQAHVAHAAANHSGLNMATPR